MIILSIRTDKPEAEIGLFENITQKAYDTWQAHRQLAETLHRRIQSLLEQHGFTWQDIHGVVCYEGPGSFTGLRIGLSVANAIAAGLTIPIAASGGENWIGKATQQLKTQPKTQPILPVYGAPVHITKPRSN